MIDKDSVLRILEEYNIDYVTRGKNVGRRVICGINCPFCGDDTGYHLGIFPEGFFTCWKNENHKGSVTFLLSYLLGISIKEAKNLLYFSFEKPFEVEEKKVVKNLELPEYFIEIEKRPLTMMFYNYLINRGFNDVEFLCKKYNIRCCVEDNEWKNRIIFPVYVNNLLVTWVGRSISANKYRIRYLNLSGEKSVMKTTDCLYNYDNLINGGEVLVITEGIFDALKVDYYSGDEKVKATCVFTSRLSDSQVYFLWKLGKVFDKFVIAFDRDAHVKAFAAQEQLSFVDAEVEVFLLEGDKKDLGEFTAKEIKSFIEKIRR